MLRLLLFIRPFLLPRNHLRLVVIHEVLHLHALDIMHHFISPAEIINNLVYLVFDMGSDLPLIQKVGVNLLHLLFKLL